MEPVVLLRRTLMVVLNVALVLSPRWRYTSFVIATLAFLLAHSIMSPFRTLVRGSSLCCCKCKSSWLSLRFAARQSSRNLCPGAPRRRGHTPNGTVTST
jgi:hypothetical protein